jgi:spermidine synthase
MTLATREEEIAALGFEVLDSQECELGIIMLRRRYVQDRTVLEIALDHQFLMSSEVTVSERELSTRALAMHGGRDLDVLVGGLGLGYTAKAVLGSERVKRLEVVEFLQPVIGWLERGLIPLAAELAADPRLTVTRGDVYLRLRSAPRVTHDLVLIDVDHSPENRLGDSNDDFYSREGLVLAKRHLRPNGVLAVWSTDPDPAFEAAMREVFDDARVDAIKFENTAIGGEETNFLFFGRARTE